MEYINKLTLLLFTVSLTGLFSCSENKKETTVQDSTSYKVIAYVAGWEDLSSYDLKADWLTHINYSFANTRDGRMISFMDTDSANLHYLIGLRAQHPHLKIIISVGGWGWSDEFSDIALTDSSRSKFAKSAAAFVKKYDLDGVDVDWEYPGLPGEGITHRPEDKENFTLLLAELRKELDATGKELNRSMVLSIASGGFDEYLDHVDMAKAQVYLDFVNVMSYDLYHGWDSIAGHHANLHLSKTATKALSADKTIELHHKHGVPYEKLILGLPFYGREWKGVNKAGKGYNQPAATGGMGINYDTIAQYLVNKNGYQRYWDSTASAPYLWNEGTGAFLSYEDEESMGLKCKYVKDKKLGGVMFWEYTADPELRLIQVISKELR